LSNSKKKTVQGLVDDSAEPLFLAIGRVVKPHGVRGEISVEVHTDRLERFEKGRTVFIGDGERALTSEGYRTHKSSILLKLAGVENRSHAENLRGKWLKIPFVDAIPLDNGEYFLFQALGLNVFTDLGDHLGKVVEIIETGANNVFVVDSNGRELLIPDIDEVILDVDIDEGKMVINVIPGLFG
jgi:16S rRNA processing protein RimM